MSTDTHTDAHTYIYTHITELVFVINWKFALSPNSYIEAVIPGGMVLGDEALGGNYVTWGQGGGVPIIRLVPYEQRTSRKTVV